MPGAPQFCFKCGIAFESSIVTIQNLPNITFVGGGISTPCPLCGEFASMPDGTYSFVGDAMEMLSGPDYAKDALSQLNELRNRVRAEGIISDEVIEVLDAVKPELANLAKLLKNKRYGPAILAGLLYLAITRCEGGGDINIDLSRHEHVTQVTATQPSMAVEDSVLYYPQKPKKPARKKPDD